MAVAPDGMGQFSKWRTRLWPIHRIELKKFIPLFLLKFLVSFNYILLFTTKETLIITAEGGGAEAIPILKGWIVLPCALLVMLIYTKLSNKLNQFQLFYAVLTPFLIFFLIFGFVLYPLKEFFSPHEMSDWLVGLIGKQREHWVSVIRYWMNSLFYVMAELWGQVVIMLLFWTLANNINRIHEAKRFYSLFSAAGDLAPMVAGALICSLCTPNSGTDFAFTVQKLMLLATAVGLVIMGIFWWVNRYLLTDTRFYSPQAQSEFKSTKPKLSLRQSLRFILSSKYLGCIALLVIGYSLAMNLVEVTWKANLRLQYPDPNAYQNFMGKFSFAIGFFPLLAALFLGGNIMRKFGWHASAKIPPIVIGVTGLLFILALLNQGMLTPLTAFFGITPLFLVVVMGAVQNVIGKTMKYSLFDPTKEVAFIPLDPESKIKGKAAIDVVGSRLGKSGSAWIQALLIDLFGMGSILNVTYLIGPIVVLVVFVWLVAVRSLNRDFSELSEQSAETR
jgi:ATP:ADP antiporter, AAA family